MRLSERCHGIEIILSDVDGVLTDGGLWFDNQSIEAKQFHVRDGLGIKLWRRAGFQFGWLTSRNSQLVKLRAAELNLDLVRQGVEDKVQAASKIASDAGLTLDRIAYIGDDLGDLPLLRAVGLAMAVADAVDEVRAVAHWVAKKPGGHGAVREAIEMVLKEKGLWQDIVNRYA